MIKSVILFLMVVHTSKAFQHDGMISFSQSVRKFLMVTGVKSDVIIAPTLPIKYNDITYFWYGSYSHNPSRPLKCEYKVKTSDKNFGRVGFPDGTRLPSIQFGCLVYEECCELECCGDSRSSTFFICLIVCVVLVIYVILHKFHYEDSSKHETSAENDETLQV